MLDHQLPAALPDEALIRQRVLIHYVPFSAQTLWRRVKAKQFPQPIKIDGGRMTAWRWGEVRQWLEAQGKEAA